MTEKLPCPNPKVTEKRPERVPYPTVKVWRACWENRASGPSPGPVRRCAHVQIVRRGRDLYTALVTIHVHDTEDEHW